MIEEIVIRNFAVIEQAAIRLSSGLNVFTGETGSGKSVLADAIRFCFGHAYAPAQYLRPGAQKIEVSVRVAFKPSRNGLLEELRRLEIPVEEDNVLIRRCWEAESGRQRAYLGDTPVTLASLKRIGALLAEFHAQGATSELFHSWYAREILDDSAGLGGPLDFYRQSYQKFLEAKRTLQEHQRYVSENRSRLDYIKHQKEELDAVSLDPKTLEQIQKDLPLWISKENIAQTLGELRQLLNGSDASILVGLSRAGALAAKLKKAAGAFPLDLAIERIKECSQRLEEAALELAELEGRIEVDPLRLEELLGIKAKAERLMKKHQCLNIQELGAKREALAEEIKNLEYSDVKEEDLQNNFKDCQIKARRQAQELSSRRSKAAKSLGPEITQAIRSLGMESAAIEIELRPGTELQEFGADEVIAWFAPNPGEGKRRLEEIASGGEASRIALVIKSLGAAPSGTILVLDEIEQGLSAHVASLVGETLRRLAPTNQILVITHSPILASFADRHFVLKKFVEQGRTVTEVMPLESQEDCRQEILRLLGAAGSREQKMLLPYVERLLKKKEAIV